VPAGAGTRYLELTGYLPDTEADRAPGEQRRWRRSLLMMPVYVDTALPTAPEGVITDLRPNPDDVGDWPQLVVDQLNEARVAAGLKPLLLTGKMNRIARDAVRTDTLEEVGKLIDLHGAMAAQGTPIRDGHTIAGVTQYLEEEVWLMLRSPAMRRSLLSKRMTRVGMAFSGPLSGDLYRHRILLAAPVGTLDPERERQRFKRSIDRWRKRKGMGTMELDRALSAAVTAHVDRICSGGASLEDTAALQRTVNALRRPFGALTLRSWRGHYIDPWQPRVVKDLAEIDAKWIGIGVCQGTVEGEKNSELVVYLGAAAP
jgi:hypothetical protein